MTLLLGMATACSDEDLVRDGTVSNQEVTVDINFGQTDFEEVELTTRATLDVVPESRVQNLMVYIFAANGERVYSHYFDNSNKYGSTAQLTDANCWTVSNMTTAGGAQTSGTVRIKAPALTNGSLYLIANIDADMVNISPERLNTVRTVNELWALDATLRQEITSRNGYFPMTACVEGVSILESGEMVKDGSNITADLTRMDAKVQVYVRVATGNELSTKEGEVTTMQKLTAFIPESWRVMNLPKAAYVMERSRTSYPADYEYNQAGYFNSEAVGFETAEESTFTYTDQQGNLQTVTSDMNGFSFYMLENRETMKQTVGGNFHLRDMRTKDANGKYMTSGNQWKYAPEEGTYLEIKGTVKMDVDVTGQQQQHLEANVTYYIHLGDISTSKDNYDIERNTHYTYTITIKGVNKIELEVNTSNGTADDVQEDEPGATGSVYVAREVVHTFDAHYGQRVFVFDSEMISSEALTWYVKTPFGREGTPEKVGGVEIPTGMDYKWVQFMVNDVAASGSYSQANQWYPGDDDSRLMDVLEFTRFVKDERNKLLSNPATSAFKPEVDTSYPEGEQNRYRLYVTAFINEFYYEEDPITGEKREGLWKEFVNQPNRIMHILSDNRVSLDGASSTTASVISIVQRAIQTPYNLHKDALTTAWGCETDDETASSGLWFYTTSETSSNEPGTQTNVGNTSQTNGLYNTACLWGLISGGSYTGTVRWDDYLNFSRENDYPATAEKKTYFLKDNYAVLRYAPLMRNRDNNGNGIIDASEMRWYIASIDQLYGLYMGEQGLTSDACLYSSARGAQTTSPYPGAHPWRNHIIASTKSSSNYPLILWAEEGISTSPYRSDIGYSKPGPYSVRCVRNLGMDYASEAEARSAILTDTPESLIKFSQVGTGTVNQNTVFRFDLSNINDKSIRFYTTRELEPADEHSEISRTFYGFETGPLTSFGTASGYQAYLDLKASLENGNSPCADGYRVPNVREAALMYLYCKNTSWWNGYTMVSTYYSNGLLGNGKDGQSPSWQFIHNNATIGQGGVNGIRSVRDWNPNE